MHCQRDATRAQDATPTIKVGVASVRSVYR